MKKDPIAEAVDKSDAPPETALMVFLEVLKLSWEMLFVAQQDKVDKVPREALQVVDLVSDMDVSSMMTQRGIEDLKDRVLSQGVVHRHLQEWTTQTLFHLACVGQRHNPYTLDEVVADFLSIFIPGGKDVKKHSAMSADNETSISYYRDPETTKALLLANPWILVTWVIRFNKSNFMNYETLAN